MSSTASKFTNPATGTSYRLVIEADGWRISKSRTDDDRLKLVHLRGHGGIGTVDRGAVDRLVAGHGGVVDHPADPVTMFADVVLVDLERTGDLLTAVAREARETYEVGCRGFRPRSPVLRQQRDRALATAADEMKRMAEAWMASGLKSERMLPGWLAAAQEDERCG